VDPVPDPLLLRKSGSACPVPFFIIIDFILGHEQYFLTLKELRGEEKVRKRPSNYK
jgi:hypothetical protein